MKITYLGKPVKKSRYARGTNQYKVKSKKDVGAYLQAFIYLMIVLLSLYIYDLRVIRRPQIDASEIQKVSPVAPKTLKGDVKGISTSTPSAVLKPQTREEKLKAFLESKKSPLAEYADYIVKQADEHDLPYTLVASIAGKESTFGKKNAGSFNAWGITTGKKTGPRFASYSSWKEGIKAASSLLDKSYRDNMAQGIQENYCPAVECSDTWVEHVILFQKEINSL